MASVEAAGPPEDWQQLEEAAAQLKGLELGGEQPVEQHEPAREATSG